MTLTDKARKGQVTRTAAQIYDDVFVPALFGQFAPILAEAAGIEAGDAVLDVACGTGIAALAARSHAGADARVAAIDINPDMLAVARTKSDAIDWHEANAEALPFADATFDRSLCLFALMFFDDRPQALREMARVTRPGGRIAAMTWDLLDRSPGYCDLVPLLREIAGDAAAEALAAPFSLGDPEALRADFGVAGLEPTGMRGVEGTARHPSIDAWIDTEIGGWTLADLVTPAQVAQIKAVAAKRLGHLCRPDGTVAFAAPAHLVLVDV